MSIILIGMRGSGKTTIGKMLAQQLGMEFIEMDQQVEKRAGMSIADFVKQNGWYAFRDEESDLIKKLRGKNNCVVSTGGGVVVRDENVRILKTIGTIIWLEADVDTLITRIGEDTNRPSLSGKPMKDDMEITYLQRQSHYKEAADYSISTEGKLPEDIVNEIKKYLHL